MTNKERLELNNAKIEEITKALAKKQVSPTDMLQQRVSGSSVCSYLFYYYEGETLDYIKNLDTSNVRTMANMFSNCKAKHIDVSNFNTSNVTDMNSMFYYCSNLSELNVVNFNTEKLVDMSSMFGNCYGLTSLDLSKWNTPNAKNMNYMFQGCSKLEFLDLSNWNASNVTKMKSAFNNCSKLTSLDLSGFNTAKVDETHSMFAGCQRLKNILGTIDVVSVYNNTQMFNTCINLENVILKNIKINIQLGSGTSWGTKLTNESLINTIKELWDYSSGTSTHTLTLSTTSKNNIANIYVKLVDVTDEMLAKDQYAGNKKPCVVCESTDDGAMTLTEYATSKNWAIA